MHNSPQARQLGELAAAARVLPTTQEFANQLLAVLRDLLVAVEDVRGVLTRKVKDYYTVEELAKLTGRSAFTIRRWIKERRIESTRVEGTGPKGRLLVARAELAKLVKAGLASEIQVLAVEEETEDHEAIVPREDDPHRDELVGLNQMAAFVSVTKRTLERYVPRLPPPDVRGRPGQANLWQWSRVRLLLEEWFNRQLPEQFPDVRRIR